MKKYIIGLFLILLIAGCQQKETTTAPPEPSGEDVVTETPPTTEVPPTTETPPAETTTETEKETPTTNDVSILGKNGFEPMEITVKKGDAIVWINNDPNGKVIVLTFQKGKKFITSSKIEAGKTYEHMFDEEGAYDYWTISYGVRGKVNVK